MTIFNIVRSLALSFAILSLCIGCTQQFSPSDLMSRASLADIELKYQELFNFENEYGEDSLKKMIEQIGALRAGGADYHPSGSLSLYFDLRAMLNQSFLGGDVTEIRVRQYLIKKIGVVSSMVSFPRSEDVVSFLSPQDRFAFTPDQIRELCGRHSPKYSSLTMILMNAGTSLQR